MMKDVLAPPAFGQDCQLMAGRALGKCEDGVARPLVRRAAGRQTVMREN
ncbi:MAG: hypothetical protein KI785_11070 [Devosiaceae bacterium]|nr:hypothetical protein [Devosiaceae bacterium MH13]